MQHSAKPQRVAKRAAKIGSTKSRLGCSTCRSRRVRCDQGRPACAHCTRLGLVCEYGQDNRRSQRLEFKAYAAPAPPLETRPQSTNNDTPARNEFQESKSRRIMELRLLHHWMTVVARPFQSTPAPRWGTLWREELPQIALHNDGVLHALLTMSATHLLPTLSSATADHESVLRAREQYLLLALESQRTAVPLLDSSNVDELSFAALLISLNAFSMLRERTLEPYEPPMDWLEMGRGAGSVMRQAAQLIDQAGSGSKLREIVQTCAPVRMSFGVDKEALKPYDVVLKHSPDVDGLEQDPELTEVYIQTLGVIAAFRKAVQAGEPPYVHLRRICMFPFTIPGRFIELVGEKQPRAFVVLAHFFTVIANTEAGRYLGNTGEGVSTSRMEVYAMQKSLPEPWRQLLIWPVDEVGGELDLKLSKIMISDTGRQPIVMDLGSLAPSPTPITNRAPALQVQDQAAEHSTMPYRAPELFDVKTGTVVDTKVDIWSPGCTLYACLAGKSPFEARSEETGGSLTLCVLGGDWYFPDEGSAEAKGG